MIEFEKFLAPWEKGEDDKPLETPADIEPGKLKKFIYNLLSDKEKLQEQVRDEQGKAAQATDRLTELQRQNENEEQRRQREEKEREKELDDLRKRNQERDKIDTIVAHYEDKGITAAQAKRLAKRVSGDDEKTWLEDADELVADGFKIGTKTTEAQPADDGDDGGDDVRTRPTVRRSDGKPPVVADKKAKSVAEELDAAGVGRYGW